VRENKLAPVFLKKALILKVKQICNKLQYFITPITTLGISTVAPYIIGLAPVSKKKKERYETGNEINMKQITNIV
jgi:hypothetical protein